MSAAMSQNPQNQGIDLALPLDAVAELIIDADLDDERLWVPRGENIATFPLWFSVSQGMWVSITRASGNGIISRHRHSAPVTGFTLDGSWGYLEHEWTATKGTFIFEPPGETHTLVVRPDLGHMMVLFHNFGPIISVDDKGNTLGFVDVFSRLEACKEHYEKVGIGADYARGLIR
jgi:2,4'-dihydroxyacetophenone dioxygenase